MPVIDDNEVSLPKATIAKIIKAHLPKGLRISGDTMQMLLDCSTEFVKLLSSEANDKSASEKKNTINPEHVMAALESLGFESFIPEVQEAWDAWNEENKSKAASSKGSNAKTAADAAGYTEEEQIKIQQKLLAGAIEGTGLMQNPYVYGPGIETDVLKEKQEKELPFPILEPNLSPSAPPVPKTSSSAFIDSSSSFLKSFEGQMDKPLSSLSIEKTDLTFSEMAAKSEILPITPLSIPTLPSSFYPQSTFQTDSHPPTPILTHLSIPEATSDSPSRPPPSKSLPIDLAQISLAQPIYFEQEGACHAATWGSILRELAKMPLMRAMVKSHQKKETVVQDPETIGRVSNPFPLKSQLPLSIHVPLPSSEGNIKLTAKGSGAPNPPTTTHHDLLIPSSSMKVPDASEKGISHKSSSSRSSVGKKSQQKKGAKDALDLEIEELRKKKAQSKKEKRALEDLKVTDDASKKTDAKKASKKLGCGKGGSSSKIGELPTQELKKQVSKVGQKGSIKKSSVAMQSEKVAIATSLPSSTKFIAPPISSHAEIEEINTSAPEASGLTEFGGELKGKGARKEKRRHGDGDEDLDESHEASHKKLKSKH